MSTNNIWAIGDVQGCHKELQQLINHPEINANGEPHFWFCGDLVNRGPDSLGVLQTVMALGSRATTVLGNHDLHLLGMAAGIRQPRHSDTTQEILKASNAQEYIDWLRGLPLAHMANGHMLVHAGVLPAWSSALALELAAEVEQVLQSSNWKHQLSNMYGNTPNAWNNDLAGDNRLRIIINAFTRMRMCTPSGHMNFSYKGEPTITNELMPWFNVPGRVATDCTIVFGHWSALGLMLKPNLIALDTGCVWGRQLTAVRLSDRKVVQVNSSD